MRKNQNGVTLLEVLVAVAIMALMAALSLPSLSKFSEGLSLRSASNRISTMMRLAQRYAITYNSVYRVDISPQLNCASIYSGDTAGTLIDKVYYPPFPVIIATNTITDISATGLVKKGAVKFYGKGTANPGCYIHIVRSNSFFPNAKDQFGVTVSQPVAYYMSGHDYSAVPNTDKEKCYTLEVEPSTGRVNLYKFGKGGPWE